MEFLIFDIPYNDLGQRYYLNIRLKRIRTTYNIFRVNSVVVEILNGHFRVSFMTLDTVELLGALSREDLNKTFF